MKDLINIYDVDDDSIILSKHYLQLVGSDAKQTVLDYFKEKENQHT